MDQRTEKYLREINRQEKRVEALYRGAAAALGMSDCGMWVLYMLLIEEQGMTQQDMGGYLSFPKQTINSSVSGLARKGYVEVRPIAGTKNKKAVLLTDAGRSFAEACVGKVIFAEGQAIRRMSAERMDQLMLLYEEYLDLLQEEFERGRLFPSSEK